MIRQMPQGQMFQLLLNSVNDTVLADGVSAMVMAFKGRFYEFHKERRISRPGQPAVYRFDIEIGPEISREDALRILRKGADVYTPYKQDAYKLASHLYSRRPTEEGPHRPGIASPTGRDDVYFKHFHPGGLHSSKEQKVGHVFFGSRGEGYEQQIK